VDSIGRRVLLLHDEGQYTALEQIGMAAACTLNAAATRTTNSRNPSIAIVFPSSKMRVSIMIFGFDDY